MQVVVIIIIGATWVWPQARFPLTLHWPCVPGESPHQMFQMFLSALAQPFLFFLCVSKCYCFLKTHFIFYCSYGDVFWSLQLDERSLSVNFHSVLSAHGLRHVPCYALCGSHVVWSFSLYWPAGTLTVSYGCLPPTRCLVRRLPWGLWNVLYIQAGQPSQPPLPGF